MDAGDISQIMIGALLALNLWQLTGLRGDIKGLAHKVHEHDREIEGFKKVFKLNGCEQSDTPGCRR